MESNASTTSSPKWKLLTADTAEFKSGNICVYVNLLKGTEHHPNVLEANITLREEIGDETYVFHFNHGLVVEANGSSKKTTRIDGPTEGMNEFFHEFSNVFEGLKDLEGFDISDEAVNYLNVMCEVYQMPFRAPEDDFPIKTVPAPQR